MAATQFFLGANTPTGFYSLYDELIDRETARSVYILKGGPGCGKSSFLRRVGRYAEAEGLETQYILCSGDPDSLDALILPSLCVALVDGTSPHVVEPSCPGVVDHYIDLGKYYDSTALQPNRQAILKCAADNKAAYRRAYRILAAAGQLDADARALLVTDQFIHRLQKRTQGIIAREIKKGGTQRGLVTRRFLSAITCTGPITLWDTVISRYSRIYELCDRYGFAHEMLSLLRDQATARGYDTIACPSPLCPDRLEHLLIPALGLAFVRSSKAQPFPGTPYRRIHLDTILLATESYHTNHTRARFTQKVFQDLYGECFLSLSQAKAAHDALELLYNPHVDFSGVYNEAEELIRTLFPTALTASP